MDVQRALILAGLALTVAGLAAAGSFMARARLRRLRLGSPGALWSALDSSPDGRPTVVAFSTPGCAACWTAQKPALAALPASVRVIQVDAAGRPEVARAFGVLTVPATVVFDGSGAVLAANQGLATTTRLAAQLGLTASMERPGAS